MRISYGRQLKKLQNWFSELIVKLDHSEVSYVNAKVVLLYSKWWKA